LHFDTMQAGRSGFPREWTARFRSLKRFGGRRFSSVEATFDKMIVSAPK